MAFNVTTGGAGWRLAGCLVQLSAEIRATYPQLVCEGTLGDAEHQAQGQDSDHNPFVKDPTGVGVVRAIDIGGPDATLRELRQHFWTLYAMQDNRLFDAGYAKGCSDNLINDQGLPFGVHVDEGDADHLHLSVTRVGDTGYAPAIDDRRTWGLGHVLSGDGTQITTDEDEMAEADIPFITKVTDPEGNPATFIVSRDGHKVRIGDGPTAENMLSLGKLPVGDRLFVYSAGFTWAGLSTYPDAK